MTILFVEDHDDTATAFSLMLRRKGYRVERANSIRAARAVAAVLYFDLLIVDRQLPDGDGIELNDIVKASPLTKGIVLSGNAYPTDIERSLNEGFSAHLCKPVRMDELFRTIDALASTEQSR